jgi:hypothetical protein
MDLFQSMHRRAVAEEPGGDLHLVLQPRHLEGKTRRARHRDLDLISALQRTNDVRHVPADSTGGSAEDL